MAKCGFCMKATGRASEVLAHQRTAHCKEDLRWGKVSELRLAGQDGAAEKLVQKILGIEPPPMTEEVKQKMRDYQIEHKEEIAKRRKTKQALKKLACAAKDRHK